MLKLIIQCDRCNKILELEIHYKNKAENIDDVLVTNNYSYIYIGDVNRLTCGECKEKYSILQDKIERDVTNKYCKFFEATIKSEKKQIKERSIK